MNLFLWVFIVLSVLSALGSLSWLAKGHIPPRTPSAVAVNVLVNLGFACWAAFLL
jgi:hypothetical protein